ncbi:MULTISPECIES: VOC family protein [Pseudomonas]
MSIGILGFDHPVIAVRDLEHSRLLYEKLGFMVPPAGRHIEWGTGNWCIMFEHDYLEHRGIANASRYTHGLEHFLAEREGLMGVAFRSDLDNRDLYRNAVDAGLHPAEPRELTRNFELPDGPLPVSFRLVFFNPQEAPALMASLVCEHLTPERLRQPEFLVHPNSAQGIFEMTSVVDSLQGIREQLSPYFGVDSLVIDDQQIKVHLPNGGVQRILTRSLAKDSGLILDGVTAPYLSSTGVRVASLDTLKQLLSRNQVPFEVLADRIRVAPQHACGMFLDFAEA